MSIVVTGATGPFGRHVVETLIRRGVPATEIVAAGRNLDKIKDLADQGVRTARIDYSDPESLRAAVAGAEKVLLVSGNDVGQRITQHTNVIDAATAAGVQHIVYTSSPSATTTPMIRAGRGSPRRGCRCPTGRCRSGPTSRWTPPSGRA